MQIRNNKRYIALILNIVVIVLEIIGLVIEAIRDYKAIFIYYTELSNLLSLIVCLIYVIYVCKNPQKEVAKPIKILKWTGTGCLTLTFLVVLFILIPMYGMSSFWSMLTKGSMLYHHFLCPVIAIISFIFFEDKPSIKFNNIFYALIPTLLYAIITITLNFLKVMVGPYPFLFVYQQPWYMSIFWFVSILGLAFLILYLLWLFNKKIDNKKKA